jgi:Na+/H+ antiporter NhaC
VNSKTRKRIVLGVVFVGVCLAAWLAEARVEAIGQTGHWYSVLPPLLAVTFAAMTGRVMTALLLSVILGGVLSTAPSDPGSPMAWVSGLDMSFGFIGKMMGDPVNQQLLVFVVFVLMMIAVVIASGGLQAIVEWMSRFARGPRSAQAVTYILGLLIFIDDYANTMIVGSSMRAVTDRFRVSREKLALLVDSTSAPVAGLAVLSTWVGYEVGLFGETGKSVGIEQTGYAMLFDALPFRFYCIMVLIFIAFLVISGKDFGPMRRAEMRARLTGEHSEPDAVPMTSDTFSTADPLPEARKHISSGLVPIGALFLILIGGVWIDGGGWEALRANPFAMLSFASWRDVISGSENSIKILAYSSAASVLLAGLFARFAGGLSFNDIRHAALAGARGSLLPMTILALAWSLKEACNALQTGSFLVAAIGDSIPPTLFPAIVFVIASLTSFATGTSYGTMAILMPTAVPIAYALEGDTYGLITMITLGSILDGAIFGDHCSPVSDTTIMSSISSSCDHMHHVRTQMPYSLTVALLALGCGYIPAGFGVPSWVGLLIAAGLIAGLFYFLKRTNEPADLSEDAARATPKRGRA